MGLLVAAPANEHTRVKQSARIDLPLAVVGGGVKLDAAPHALRMWLEMPWKTAEDPRHNGREIMSEQSHPADNDNQHNEG
ncbi:MAG: hypothetical protein JSR20_06125 [Nitrospira sp.]|nr:hypothetical protein [Nitrospira sp.]